MLSKSPIGVCTMRRRILKTSFVGAAACVIAIVFWARSHYVVLDGTLQFGFEESAFFPKGDCSNTPFWWEWRSPSDSPEGSMWAWWRNRNKLNNDLDLKWKALGKPAAMRVKVRGYQSSEGRHGHLGFYRREFQPIALISVSPASRCQW
jgi:hypothetical protein